MLFEFIPFLIFCIAAIFLVNFSLSYFRGGLRNNLLNIFTNLIFIIYLCNTPIVYYFRNFYLAFNVNIKDYYGVGFLQILLHLVFYNLGYFLFLLNKRKSLKYTHSDYRILIGKRVGKVLFGLFIISYLAVFVNTMAVGINLLDVFLGKYGDPTLGLRGGSYYVQNLADSLISFLIVGYFFKIKKQYFIIMLLISIPLFLVLGFRYRLLLSFFGIILIFIYDKGLTFRSILKYLAVFFIALYAMLLLTQNRYTIYMQKYDNLTFDMSEFDYDIIFDQARGSVMDFAVYQYIDNNLDKIDLGETMFGYIFIKMTPSFFFKNNTKPYPPPQLPIIDEAIGGTRDNGEAVTSLGGAFIAFYYPGIYIMAFLLGVVIAKLQNRFEKSSLSMITSIIINVALFQWISRGYFPQEVDHLAYMLLPIILIKLFAKELIEIKY